jgi:uncharacterized membrane-anchored protein
MQLKITPNVGPRYWTAIMIASMCGANFGDVLPDILKLSTGLGLLVEIAMFAAIILADRMTRHGSEAFYWLSILVVRAAATNIADFSIAKAHFGYAPVAVALAALLTGLILVHRGLGPQASTGTLPPTNGFYWFTMLTAGALGTIMGDGIGHSFGPVTLGVPISAGAATLAMALMLGAQAALKWTTAVAYWVTIVVVRWWGTNFGDMLAFFLGLTVSMAVTGAALAGVLVVWRAPLRGPQRRPTTAGSVKNGTARKDEPHRASLRSFPQWVFWRFAISLSRPFVSARKPSVFLANHRRGPAPRRSTQSQ